MKAQLSKLIPAVLALCVLDAAAVTRYVDLNSPGPTPPFTSWPTAATNIQDAIDAAAAGDLILVTNGIYQTGGRPVYGSLTNRIVVDKAVTVQSVNGPAVTVIQGSQAPGIAVRCALLVNGVVLAGFTLTNGVTPNPGSDFDTFGAGAWCESTNVILSNCVLVANSAIGGAGGGVYLGTLYDCTLIGNSALTGGGARDSILNNCRLTANTAISGGGGASGSTLNNCTLDNNSAPDAGGAAGGFLKACTLTNNLATANYGGGVSGATLNDCLLIGNTAHIGGGGASSATLINCRLFRNSTPGSGGGAYSCTLSNCLVGTNTAANGGGVNIGTTYNSLLFGNSVTTSGGGAYGGVLKNCAVVENSARTSGGGAYTGTLNNCTLAGNSALSGGGMFSSTLTNCIVYLNRAGSGTNYVAGALNYCCTTPLPPGGFGNITAEPQLADRFHISAGSPCRGVGNVASLSGVDVDGEVWANPPSIGCDEYLSGSITGLLSVAVQSDYANVATGFVANFTAQIWGHASASVWDFGDGIMATNLPYITHQWPIAGDYVVTLRAMNEDYPAGISASATIRVRENPVQYVMQGNLNPIAPYTSWATAATNIQDAIDAAFGSGRIVVSNGVYQTGGRTVYDSLTNRVVVNKTVTVQSLNGPNVTAIQGYQVPGTVTGSNAIRCVYLTSGASLTGFTITNGATRSTGTGATILDLNGGGVWCETDGAILSNCVLVANAAGKYGGGNFLGTLNSCTIISNRSFGQSLGGGGGSCLGTLNNCLLIENQMYGGNGGGAMSNVLNDCVLAGNYTLIAGGGGGAYGSTLNGCLLTNNLASGSGGGAINCSLTNCTVVNNLARSSGGGAYGGSLSFCFISGNRATNLDGGGTYNCTAVSSIISSNWARADAGGASGGTLVNCSVVGNFSLLGSGGGAKGGTLTSCLLYGNRAANGGAASGAVLVNCLVTGNSATNNGGGVSSCTLNNVTVVTNTSIGSGGGAYQGTLRNSILYFNSASTSSNVALATVNNCCTIPAVAGSGNFTNAPRFVDQLLGNFRLQTNSPCIGTGNNGYVTTATDLDGRPRIVGGTVDVGAYEFQSAGIGEFTAWLQASGLPSDGSADFTDADGDGMNNYGEWRSDTIPTNTLSVLCMVAATNSPSGTKITWQSVATRSYWLERATNLGSVPQFSAIASNLAGVSGTKTYTDASATNAGPYFYRVGVQ